MNDAGRPQEGEFAPYFERYISLVPGEEILSFLETQTASALGALAAVPGARAGFRYAPGKWSVREVVGHLADCERVFDYRLLAIARGEKAALPPFDENEFARLAGHDAVPLLDLVDELAAVRAGTMHLLRHLPGEAWTRIGTASSKPTSVRAVAFVIGGHVAHHMAILRDRYGVAWGG